MRKIYLLLCITVLIPGFNLLKAQCDPNRYYNKVFSNNTTTVQYGSAIEYDGTPVNLMVDVYQPTGDNFAHRPLMIFAFGGSFTSGVRQSPDLSLFLCPYFAQRGYVTASIDYRLGFDSLGGTPDNQFKALIRAVQDMKGAVRYFYKDAQTTDQFRIDTNQIFIGGVSAGAFIALNYAYLKLDTLSKPAPPFAVPDIIALGGLDGNSGNPGYNTKVKGVIDLCGAIADTVWIMPGDPILVGVHGTADSTVACYYDSLYALQNTKSSLFGGGDIKNRLSHIQMTDSFYLFQGADHCPFIIPHAPTYNPIPWMDTTETIIRDFLYPNIICDATTVSGINDINNELSLSVFPNPSNDVIYIKSDYVNDLSVSVLTVQGQLVQQALVNIGSPLAISKTRLGAAGMYLLQFTDKGSKEILRTEKIIFY